MAVVAPYRRTVEMLMTAVAPVSLLLGASQATADVYWDTTVTAGNWNVPANWLTTTGTVNGVPSATDFARIASTTTSETVTLNTNQSVSQLNIGSSVTSGTTTAVDVLDQSANLSCISEVVGNGMNTGGGAGKHIQTGGTYTVSGYMVVGLISGTTGEYDISNSAVLNMTGTGTSGTGLYVSEFGSGTFNQTGGTVSIGSTTASNLYLGYYANGVGTYNLSGGSLTVSGTADVGTSGSGIFSVASAVTINGGLELGANDGSNGTVALGSGGLLTDNNVEEHVGQSGTATFTQTGGTHTAPVNLLLGVNSGSSGTYNLSGGTLTQSGGYEFVGYSGAGTFNQTGGTQTVNGVLVLGSNPGASAAYNLSDPNSAGTKLTVTGNEVVGAGATGTATAPASNFTQSAGTQTVGSAGTPAGVVVAQGGGTFAGYTLTGTGALTVYGPIVVGESGSGTFTQSGGTLMEYGTTASLTTVGSTSQMHLGLSTGGVGTYQLTNGSATLPSVFVGGPGTGTLLQSGGYLNVNSTLSVAANGTVHLSGGQAAIVQLTDATGSSFTADKTANVSFFLPLSVPAGATFQLLDNSYTTLVDHAASPPPSVIRAFMMAPTATLDVENLSVDFPGGSLSALTVLVANGFDAGREDLPGIVSNVARFDTTHHTTVGVIQNNQPGYAVYTSAHTFHGIVLAPSDVLLAYTYFGDANLDGKVDGSDYTLIDNGYNLDAAYLAANTGSTALPATGWYNGDFNYDGLVDGSDYTLIDNGFNTQAGRLASSGLFAGATDQIANTSAVPEPVAVALFLPGGAFLLRRRRKYRLEFTSAGCPASPSSGRGGRLIFAP